MKGRTSHVMLAVLVAAAVSAPGGMTQTAEASSCTTTDATLLSAVQSKIQRHAETGRADLHEMFTKSYNTMKGNDSYTTADIKARADKQGDKWQGAGPNELWQKVYSELDRLEACRDAAATPADTTPPVLALAGDAAVAIQKGATYTDAGATCTDDTDGAISPVSTGTVDTTTAGVYTISYSCTDAAGNAATQVSRVVIVQDAQPPQPAAPETQGGVPETQGGEVLFFGSSLDNTPRITLSGPSFVYAGNPLVLDLAYSNVPPNTQLEAAQSFQDINFFNFQNAYIYSGSTPSQLVITEVGEKQIPVGSVRLRVDFNTVDSNEITVEIRPAPYTLAMSGGPSITHLASLHGDGLRFDLNGDRADIKRIEWKVTNERTEVTKTYKTVYEECNVSVFSSAINGCGLSEDGHPWWLVNLGSVHRYANGYFKIGGQPLGAGGSVYVDVGNDFDVGTHKVFAVVTTKDGSTFTTPQKTFTVTSRAVPTILLTHIDHGSYVSFHASASAGGGTGNHISWYVNDVRQTHHERIGVDGSNNVRQSTTGLGSTDTHFNFKPPTKPSTHTDPAAVYNVYARLTYGGAHGTDHEAGRTAVTTLTYNPPSPPMPPELQITGSVTMYGDTAEIDYGYLGYGGLSLAWETSQWQIRSDYVRIAERDGTNPVSLAGSYAGWLGDCGVRNLGFGRGFVPITCDIDNPSHRSMLKNNGYAFATYHYYELSGSKVTAINALDDPYVFIRTDSDSTFKPVVKLSKPRG